MRGKISLAIVLAGLLAAFGLTHAEPQSPDSIVRVGAVRMPDYAWGVFVEDTIAYVADRAALVIVNVANPSSPWIVYTLTGFRIHPVAVAVADTVAYSHNDFDGDFAAISVADPSAPYQLGWCYVSSGSGLEPKGIHAKDGLAFLAQGNKGFDIVDVANPSSPALVDSCDTPGIGVDLFAKDTLVYVADYDSLQIFSVVDPSGPYRVGACSTPNPCYDVCAVDTFAYVVCESGIGTDGTLQTVNVSDPTAPFVVNSVTMNGDPFAVYVSGDYAYVAAADWWSDKGSRTAGGLRPSWADGLPADVEGGLRIVDISDPASPVLVASYDTPGDPRDVFVQGDLVFIADYDSLQILRHVVVGVQETAGPQSTVTGGASLNIHPNPMREDGIIRFLVPRAGIVKLCLCNIVGQPVRILMDKELGSGQYSVEINTPNLPSGVYFCRLTAGRFTATSKMVISRRR